MPKSKGAFDSRRCTYRQRVTTFKGSKAQPLEKERRSMHGARSPVEVGFPMSCRLSACCVCRAQRRTGMRIFAVDERCTPSRDLCQAFGTLPTARSSASRSGTIKSPPSARTWWSVEAPSSAESPVPTPTLEGGQMTVPCQDGSGQPARAVTASSQGEAVRSTAAHSIATVALSKHARTGAFGTPISRGLRRQTASAVTS